MRTREERRAKWAQLVGEQEASGLSGRAFCRDRGVSVARFYQWRKRLTAAEECKGPGFVEVNVSDRGTDAGIRLRLTNGSVELVLERNFDVPTLQQAVAALGAATE